MHTLKYHTDFDLLLTPDHTIDNVLVLFYKNSTPVVTEVVRPSSWEDFSYQYAQ